MSSLYDFRLSNKLVGFIRVSFLIRLMAHQGSETGSGVFIHNSSI